MPSLNKRGYPLLRKIFVVRAVRSPFGPCDISHLPDDNSIDFLSLSFSLLLASPNFHYSKDFLGLPFNDKHLGLYFKISSSTFLHLEFSMNESFLSLFGNACNEHLLKRIHENYLKFMYS